MYIREASMKIADNYLSTILWNKLNIKSSIQFQGKLALLTTSTYYIYIVDFGCPKR